MSSKRKPMGSVTRLIPAPNDPGSEKRKHPRRLAFHKTGLKLKVLNKDGSLLEQLVATISDLSLSGFCTSVVEKVHVRAPLELEFTHDDEPYKLFGIVAHCTELPSYGKIIKGENTPEFKWRIGIQIDLTKEGQKAIMDKLFEIL